MQLDNINVTIPDKYLKWNYRRAKRTAKVNVSFSYTSPSDVEIFHIAATESVQFNVEWSTALRVFLKEFVKGYVEMEMSFDRVMELVGDEILEA